MVIDYIITIDIDDLKRKPHNWTNGILIVNTNRLLPLKSKKYYSPFNIVRANTMFTGVEFFPVKNWYHDGSQYLYKQTPELRDLVKKIEDESIPIIQELDEGKN